MQQPLAGDQHRRLASGRTNAEDAVGDRLGRPKLSSCKNAKKLPKGA